MDNKELVALLAGKGGGGSVTVDSAMSASSENPVQNKVITAALGSKANAPTVITVTGATVSLTPQNNRIYKCGELTSITITDPPATGAWSIVFTSGATATTTTSPATSLGLESFAAEANTLYEINVMDNRAVVGSWAVSA